MKAEVAIVSCKNYERNRVFEKVHETLAFFGGIESFVEKGQKVLVKPNMLSAKEPERAITTHPFILEAIVAEAQQAGGRVLIGDSPAGALKGVKRCWEKTGFLGVAERTGAELISFEAEGSEEARVENRVYHLAKAVQNADVVINLPKFKTHGFALFTGAIKNLYGTLPGFQKATYHKLNPHPAKFSEILVDLYSLVKPGFHLMDAVIGMEGNGPSTGDPRQVGLLLGAADGIALDTVASTIMGFAENEVDAIRIAGERGVGKSRLDEIAISGLALEDVRIPDFNLPSNHLMKLVPEFLVKWAGRFLWVRPVVDRELCVGCGLCVEGCPVQAITMVNQYPEMDYSKCINCMCCNESCPANAITQKLSRLAKRLG